MPIVDVHGENVEFPDNMSDTDIANAIKGIKSPSVSTTTTTPDDVVTQARSNPEGEGSAIEAAAHGFSQGVTLGLGKYGTAAIQSLIYKAAGGQGPMSDAYSRFAQENTDQENQLKQQQPSAYGAGTAASFAVPFGGTGQLFKAGSTAAREALTAGRSAIEVAQMGKAAKLGQEALAGGAGAALAGGVQTLGETGSPQEAASQAEQQGVAGAAGPLVLGAMAPVVKPIANVLGNVAKATVSKATGVPWEAMQQYAQNPAAIKEAAGTEKDLGQELVNHLQSIKEENIGEAQQARALLDRVGPANLARVKAAMEAVAGPAGEPKKAMSPEEQKVINNLQDWLQNYLPEGQRQTTTVTAKRLTTSPMAESQLLDWLQKNPGAPLYEDLGLTGPSKGLVPSGKTLKAIGPDVVMQGPEQIPATQMEEVKRSLQGVANKYYGQEGVPAYISTIKGAASEARQALIDAADKSGVPEYGQAMQDVASKIQTRNDLDEFLGNVIKNKPDVATRMFETLNGKGVKNYQRLKALDSYDDMFGTNFRDQAENAATAKQVGPGGQPSLLSRAHTGAINLPTILGLLSGAATGYGYGSGYGSAGKNALGMTLGAIGGTVAGEVAASPAAWTTGMMTSIAVKKLADKIGVPAALKIMKSAAPASLGNLQPQNQGAQ